MKTYFAKIYWFTQGNAIDYKLVNANNEEEAREKVDAIYKPEMKPDTIVIEEPL